MEFCNRTWVAGMVVLMTTKFDPYVKAYRRIINSIMQTGKAQDVGFFFLLAERSREENLSGFLTENLVRNVALQASFSSFRVSLVRLQASGVITKVEGGYQLDWTGQTTAEKRAAIQESNRVKQQKRRDISAERQSLHIAGDHSKCLLPYCPLAARWARGKKPVDADSHRGTSPGGPLETKKIRSSLSGNLQSSTEEDGSDGPAQAPPGQRSDAGAPTLPGPSSDTDPSAPTKSAPATSVIDFSDDPELTDALNRLDALKE